MPEHHKGSLLLVENQHKGLGMPQKSMLYSLIVICLTILLFTWMVRDSLCELHIKQGNNELAASLACDINQ
jgi:protein HokA